MCERNNPIPSTTTGVNVPTPSKIPGVNVPRPSKMPGVNVLKEKKYKSRLQRKTQTLLFLNTGFT